MLELYLNTVTREWFDRNGNPFRDSNPKMAFRSRDTIKIIACTSTPKAGESGANPGSWPRDASWASISGIGAKVTVDTDYIHKVKGLLTGGVPAGEVTSITAIFSGITAEQIAPSGVLRIYSDSGEYEAVAYTSRSVSGDSVTFAASGAVAGTYPAEATVDCDQAPYCEAYLGGGETDIEQGVFCFELVVDSFRLREEMQYNNVAALAVNGIELLFYRQSNGNNEPIKAFLCETFSITGTLGNLDYEAKPPDLTENKINGAISGYLAQGISVETQSVKNAKQMRIRFKADGGIWSEWVDLPPGKDGKDGTPGKDGTNGKDGVPGRDGADGKDGAAGAQGQPGQGLTWDAAGSLQERDTYANEAAGFTFASFVTDAANKTTKLYLYKKRTSAHGDWCAPVVITYYSRDGENVKLIPPLEFAKPAGTQNYLYFAQNQYPAATIAAVCIDTAEGELRLPYDSALGVTKIVKKNGTFYVYFGSLVPAFTTGRVYFAQGVMAGDVIPPTGGAPLYYGYITDAAMTSITQITQSMLEAETLNSMPPATLGKTLLGTVPAGSWPVVLIPATSALAAYKDNGFGGRIGFSVNNGAAGTGANGATVQLGGDTYKVYGEFKLNTAEVFIYVE